MWTPCTPDGPDLREAPSSVAPTGTCVVDAGTSGRASPTSFFLLLGLRGPPPTSEAQVEPFRRLPPSSRGLRCPRRHHSNPPKEGLLPSPPLKLLPVAVNLVAEEGLASLWLSLPSPTRMPRCGG